MVMIDVPAFMITMNFFAEAETSAAASAFGVLVLPRFADADLPASMKAKPSLIQQKR